MIPLLDLNKQTAPIRKEIGAAINSVIESSDFILGKSVLDFERNIALYAGVKYALGVSNGTDAIKLSLIALGLKPEDKVICPSFTYYATAGAIVSAGCVPVFADIDPLTYTLSISSLENILRKKDKKIKAVIPVHLYGQCADMDPIMALAGKHGLKVIEDTAQAFGAEYRGRKAGTIADCGTVSFFPAKNLGAFGDAGMVLTNNAVIAEKIRILRNQGNKERYFHDTIGFNNRMDSIQAAVLNVKLKYLDLWNRKRRANAAYFNRLFSSLGSLTTPYCASYGTHIYHQYVLRLPCANELLMGHLKKKHIDARIYYPLPLHMQKCFRYLGYKKGAFPESEAASHRTLAIPVYPDLPKKDMDYIFSTIKEFIRDNAAA